MPPESYKRFQGVLAEIAVAMVWQKPDSTYGEDANVPYEWWFKHHKSEVIDYLSRLVRGRSEGNFTVRENGSVHPILGGTPLLNLVYIPQTQLRLSRLEGGKVVRHYRGDVNYSIFGPDEMSGRKGLRLQRGRTAS